MKNPGFYYYPIRILVTNKDRPVVLNTALPANLKEVIGIRVVHSGGINLYRADDPLLSKWPTGSIGWMNIAFNNRSYELGNIDLTFNIKPTSSEEHDYLDVMIPLQKNTIVTGIYNNIFDPEDWHLANRFRAGSTWINYVVTLYLKCTKEHD